MIKTWATSQMSYLGQTVGLIRLKSLIIPQVRFSQPVEPDARCQTNTTLPQLLLPVHLLLLLFVILLFCPSLSSVSSISAERKEPKWQLQVPGTWPTGKRKTTVHSFIVCSKEETQCTVLIQWNEVVNKWRRKKVKNSIILKYCYGVFFLIVP